MIIPEAPRDESEAFKWRMLLVDYLKQSPTVITITGDVDNPVNYTLPANDHLVFVDADLDGVTITLPPVPTGTDGAKIVGLKMIIKRTDTNSGNDVIIDGNGVNIDGLSTLTLSSGLDDRTVVSDGINWYLV